MPRPKPKPPARPEHAPALALDGQALDITAVEQVARQGRPVALARGAAERLARSRAALEAFVASGEPIYGVNTGFGSLSRQRIAPGELRKVQHNLIRSHSAGIGEPLHTDVVRAMLLLLAASLARGHSGVSPALVEELIAFLNSGVTPIVPSIGSVGASGDLAPLAHAALVLIGEGEAEFAGRRLPATEALKAAGLRPIALGPKEGLALINGTHLMAAQAALAIADIDRVFDAAVAACAMSIDACRATDAFLDDRIHAARGQPGQSRVAARLRTMLAGSGIIPSHAENDPRVQDPYSLRCAPQVLGAALDAIDSARRAVARELGAVTDNPLIFEEEGSGTRDKGPGRNSGRSHAGARSPIRGPAVISAGNFHGLPLAIPMDTLAIALSHIAGISERRTFLMLAASDPESHLRPYLSPRPGLHSGLMVAQYTAAACCNELIGLATPASVANLSTSAGMEDYNSFGPRCGAKLRRAVDLCAHVVAIELLCAAQGLEFHRPLKSGHGVERCFATVRHAAAPLVSDRPPGPDIAAITSQVLHGRFGD